MADAVINAGNRMQPLGNFLAYGAIGLGLALAVLAFRLLSQEQKLVKPRREIVRAIYVFMAFALILAAGGFVIEFLKSDASAIGPVKSQLDEKSNKLAALEEKYRQVDQSLSSLQGLMSTHEPQGRQN